MWQEILNATVFVSPPGNDGPAFKVLAAMIDAMFDMEADQPLHVVLAQAQQVCDADAAVLSVPVDAETMEIRGACGEQSESLIGQRFDRGASVAGLVLDSGESAFVGMKQLKSPIDSLSAFGPMLITPLRGLGPVGTLGLTRLYGRPRFEATDLVALHEFADLASIALQIDDARAIRETQRIGAERALIAAELFQTVIRGLSGISLGIGSMAGVVQDEISQAKVRRIMDEIDALIRSIRTNVFGASQ